MRVQKPLGGSAQGSGLDPHYARDNTLSSTMVFFCAVYPVSDAGGMNHMRPLQRQQPSCYQLSGIIGMRAIDIHLLMILMMTVMAYV
jgi:hypothetical protein